MIPASSSVSEDPPSGDEPVRDSDPLPTASALPTHPRRRYPRRLRPDSSHPYTQGLPANVPYNPALAPLSEQSREPSVAEEQSGELAEEQTTSQGALTQEQEEREDPPLNNIPSTSAEGAAQPSTSTDKVVIPVEDEVVPSTGQESNAPPNGQPITAGSAARKRNAMSKLSMITKLMKRNNRVVDSYTEQNEFMQKFGVGNGDVAQAEQQQTTEQIAGGSKWRHYLKSGVINSASDAHYRWTVLVSIAYIYNLLFVIARYVFVELEQHPWWLLWLGLDILFDIIYVLDMFVRTRTGFLEQGMLVKDINRIWKSYVKSRQFRMDVASILPFDYLNTSVKQGLFYFAGISDFRGLPFRLNRLARIDRVTDCMERTETRSSMPNAFRVCCVVWYIIVIIHWNACFYFFISECIGLGSDTWVYGVLNKQSLPDGVVDNLSRRYIYSFYWSTLILTTIGEVPGPVKDLEFFFVTMDLMCGVLIFATIVGNVGSMISNMSAARTEFQNKMDGIKQYMELRRVSKQLELRVIKWFDYLWANKQTLTDQQVLKVLPDKLQAEIAMQVHFETLRKVRIFQDCEAGLLAELVLKLQLQVFSPGDYICRKGDIGREMYIVKRGKLQVVGEDGMKVFATLQEGAVFGELSILNIAGSKNGNRRTANVRSVGYTDLFVLNKNDLWTALREYPEARKMLLAKGREILRKDNLLDEDAPDEQKSAEELAEELNTSVKALQQRMAKLIVEHTSTEQKLNTRIAYLEGQLLRYKQEGEEKERRRRRASQKSRGDPPSGDGEDLRPGRLPRGIEGERRPLLERGSSQENEMMS